MGQKQSSSMQHFKMSDSGSSKHKDTSNGSGSSRFQFVRERCKFIPKSRKKITHQDKVITKVFTNDKKELANTCNEETTSILKEDHVTNNLPSTSSKLDVAHTSKLDGAHTSKFDGAHTSKLDGAHTSKLNGAHTSKLDGAHTSKLNGTHTSKLDGAHTSKLDGAHTSKLEAAHASKLEAAHTSKLDGARTIKLEAAHTSKLNGAHTSKLNGAQAMKLDGAHTSKLTGAQGMKLDGAHAIKLEGIHTNILDSSKNKQKYEPDYKKMVPCTPKYENTLAAARASHASTLAASSSSAQQPNRAQVRISNQRQRNQEERQEGSDQEDYVEPSPGYADRGFENQITHHYNHIGPQESRWNQDLSVRQDEETVPQPGRGLPPPPIDLFSAETVAAINAANIITNPTGVFIDLRKPFERPATKEATGLCASTAKCLQFLCPAHLNIESLRVLLHNLHMDSLNKCHTRIDYIHYLVPDLKEITACSFYWGKMDRYEAERLLDGRPEGTFLLRDSAQDDFLFSVSFRKYGRSLHARVEQWNHKFSFDSHDPGVFSSDTVCGLIEHYKDPACCMFFEPTLTVPLNRNFVFDLQHLSRSVITSCVIKYDEIDSLPLPKSLKTYLKVYHYRQRIRVKHFDDIAPTTTAPTTNKLNINNEPH